MAVDEIVDVIAVRHGLMTAAVAMDVCCIMTATAMIWSTPIWILVGDFDHMFIHMIPVGMMQMRVVKVVDVPAMANSDVSTSRPVRMTVVCVVRKITARHFFSLR